MNIALRDHVLVKGWFDSGTVEAVYGPYTLAEAEWIRAELLENSTYNWTLAKLRSFPATDCYHTRTGTADPVERLAEVAP